MVRVSSERGAGTTVAEEHLLLRFCVTVLSIRRLFSYTLALLNDLRRSLIGTVIHAREERWGERGVIDTSREDCR